MMNGAAYIDCLLALPVLRENEAASDPYPLNT